MTFSRIEFHVLLALAAGPRHGYGIMQDVAELTSRRVSLGPGTLYSVIKRFERLGLIEECDADADRRRCYRLTRRGRTAAAEEAEQLAEIARWGRQRLLVKRS